MDCGTVLVVDADDSSRTYIGALLAQAGLNAVGATTAAEAFARCKREEPDLVLLDVALPDLDGFAACRQLREQSGEALPIMLLSAHRTDAHDRLAALLLGADDYLVTPFDPAELVARARRHVARSRTNGNGRTGPNGHDEPAGPDFGLTPREREVLHLLASGLDQGAISRRLVISPKTVASHITRILAKLGVHSRAQAVAVAHRESLVADFEAHASVFTAPAPV